MGNKAVLPAGKDTIGVEFIEGDGTNNILRMTTLATADTKSWSLLTYSGTAQDATRGASLQLFGADHATQPGDAIIATSNDVAVQANYSAGVSGAQLFMDGSTGDFTIDAEGTLNLYVESSQGQSNIRMTGDIVIYPADDFLVAGPDQIRLEANYSAGVSGARMLVDGINQNTTIEAKNDAYIQANYSHGVSGARFLASGSSGQVSLNSQNNTEFYCGNDFLVFCGSSTSPTTTNLVCDSSLGDWTIDANYSAGVSGAQLFLDGSTGSATIFAAGADGSAGNRKFLQVNNAYSQVSHDSSIYLDANYSAGVSGAGVFMDGSAGSVSFYMQNDFNAYALDGVVLSSGSSTSITNTNIQLDTPNIFLNANHTGGVSGCRLFMNGSTGGITYDTVSPHVFRINGANRLTIENSGGIVNALGAGADDRVRTANSARPGYEMYIGASQIGVIFADNGGFATGSNNAVAIRAGGSVNGVHLPSGGTTWASHSDSRIKKNIIPIKYGLSAILALDPKNFDYNSDTTENSDRMGLIAQDVLLHIPDIVCGNGGQQSGIYSICYQDLIPVLIKAIQELEARIATLETP